MGMIVVSAPIVVQMTFGTVSVCLVGIKQSQRKNQKKKVRNKLMSKVNKPTNQGLFDTVITLLKEQGKLPEILDYHLHEHNLKEISDYQFNCNYKLDFGGSEGIYLDCYIEGICGEDEKFSRLPLGTIKTLSTSEDAMAEMGKLAGYFSFALSKYVNQNIDDFTWKGFDVNFYKEDGTYAFGYSCSDKEKALKRAEENKVKYAKVILRDNRTREETQIK
jgi:hypothetical protein